MAAPWTLDPVLIAGLVAASALYARGVSIVWRRAGGPAVVGRGQVASFAGGVYVLALAVVSPIDALAHVLFTVHMVQHVLLMLVAAPLLAYGAPVLPWLWGLPRGARLAVARRWKAGAGLRRAWHAATGPLPVWSALTATLWFWHLPGPYQAAVGSPSIHGLEHATMLGASVVFWWVVLQPQGRRRIDGGTAVLLVFATKVQSAALGALVTFVPRPLYPVYEAGAASWGMTLLEDQQLAGLIMGTVSGLVYLGAGAALFLSWLRSVERRAEPGGSRGGAPTLRVPDLDPSTVGEARGR